MIYASRAFFIALLRTKLHYIHREARSKHTLSTCRAIRFLLTDLTAMASSTDESEPRLLPSHPQHQRSHTLTEADIFSAQGSSNEPRNRTWTVYTSLLIISAILPVIFLVLWIVLAGTKDTVFMTFSGAHIGGKFNQPQAKAVDVACSAVLAPLIMTGLNYLWFGSARVSTFNDQHPRIVRAFLSQRW